MKLTQTEAKKIVVNFTVALLEDHGVGLALRNKPEDKRREMVKAFRMMGMDKHNLHALGQCLGITSEAVDAIFERGR